MSKPKWGAQAAVRGARPPWIPRSDGAGALLKQIKKLKHQPEIIAISSTKLQDNSVRINFQLDGYDFVHVDSPTQAGGVGFLVKNRINFITCDDIKLNLPYVEDLWIEIDGEPKLVVRVIYRHPKQTVDKIDEFGETLR